MLGKKYEFQAGRAGNVEFCELCGIIIFDLEFNYNDIGSYKLRLRGGEDL